MKSWLLLNVVVWKSSSIFKLFTSENKTLLIWWDSFFILDLGLNIFDRVWWFYVQCYGFACQCFDKNLHATSKSQNKMECRFFLNVIVRESSTIFQLLTGKDKSLLIWWDSFFVLDFGLYILDRVWWFYIKSDCLSCQCFDKNLHAASES